MHGIYEVVALKFIPIFITLGVYYGNHNKIALNKHLKVKIHIFIEVMKLPQDMQCRKPNSFKPEMNYQYLKLYFEISLI